MKIMFFTAVKYCSILHGNVCVMYGLREMREKTSKIETRNEVEFDRSRLSRRTKVTNISQQLPINIFKSLNFFCR